MLIAQQLYEGNFDDGWKYYEHRNSKITDFFRDTQEWTGEKIDNKSILVFNEQGIGDSIQFSKYIIPLTKISKNVTFERFIYALGIKEVGEVTSKNLAKEYKSIENLFFPSPDRLIEINDIGEVVAENISTFFSDKKVINKIKTMQDLGVNISHEEQISSSNEFQDMSFVITGKFSKFSRNELKGIIESKGGKVSGSISSKTNYLVLGEDPGSKLEKAQKLKIDILTEDDF